MFELSYEPLWKDDPGSWKAALVPWDSETFGFNVADLRVQNPPQAVSTEMMQKAIQSYVKDHNIAMMIAAVPGQNKQLNLLLQSMNFVHIDIAMSIQYIMSEFQSRACRIILRRAEKKEFFHVADMAERLFEHGRYHLDYKLSLNLAHKRYRDWVLRTQMEGNPQQLLVAEIQDALCGFSILEQKNEDGYLHLMGLSPEWRGKGLGMEITDLSLSYLKNQGVKTVRSKVSALNPNALNMYFTLGAKIVDCEHILHWHSF